MTDLIDKFVKALKEHLKDNEDIEKNHDFYDTEGGYSYDAIDAFSKTFPRE